MKKSITIAKARRLATMHKRQAPMPNTLTNKMPWCKKLAIATYHHGIRKKRTVIGYIFLYPTITKHEEMIPGDEILQSELIAIQITSPTMHIFTSFIKKITHGDFTAIENIMRKISPQSQTVIQIQL